MCKVLHVTRSSYYHWKKYRVTNKSDQIADQLIKQIFLRSRHSYGTRRIKTVLIRSHGIIMSRRRIAKVMRNLGLNVRSKRKFNPVTTDSSHRFAIVPNRLRQNFNATAPDRTYVGDITYIPTQEGWLYLATVIDLYSRKVVGWSMDRSIDANLVNNALLMALQARQPAKGLLWHTDRGTQYASEAHRKLLRRYGIIQSMSAKGNCYDNAVAESFFHSLKTELVHHVNFETRSQANQAIFEYIEVFYNRQRLHSSNNYLSPMDFEKQMLLHETSA